MKADTPSSTKKIWIHGYVLPRQYRGRAGFVHKHARLSPRPLLTIVPKLGAYNLEAHMRSPARCHAHRLRERRDNSRTRVGERVLVQKCGGIITWKTGRQGTGRRLLASTRCSGQHTHLYRLFVRRLVVLESLHHQPLRPLLPVQIHQHLFRLRGRAQHPHTHRKFWLGSKSMCAVCEIWNDSHTWWETSDAFFFFFNSLTL